MSTEQADRSDAYEGDMLHAGAVIAVSDLARARAFYEGRLGLVGEETVGGWIVRAGGGSVLYLLVDDGAGTATWPVASFRVTDLVGAVRALRARGVPFLTQGELTFTVDDDGIAHQDGMRVAWMRDPDGSILTIFSIEGAG